MIIIERTWKEPNPCGGGKLSKVERKVFDDNDRLAVQAFISEKSKISGYEWSDISYKYIKL